MKAPIGWYGGKGRLAERIIKLMPRHRIYVEVFGGAASVLFAKRPSPVEVYNDVYSEVVNFFRVLRDPEKFEKFFRMAIMTPNSREEFETCRDTLECGSDVERAWKFFVVGRQSFSGGLTTWGFSVRSMSRWMGAACARWLAGLERLPEIHARLMRVQIEHNDFRRIIPTYDTPETLFYCDPPYIPDTRKSPDAYEHEMTAKDHRDLVDLLLRIEGMAILSGYRHPIYKPLEEAGWRRLDRRTSCHAAGRTRNSGLQGEGAATAKVERVESVWLSPNCFKRGKG